MKLNFALVMLSVVLFLALNGFVSVVSSEITSGNNAEETWSFTHQANGGEIKVFMEANKICRTHSNYSITLRILPNGYDVDEYVRIRNIDVWLGGYGYERVSEDLYISYIYLHTGEVYTFSADFYPTEDNIQIYGGENKTVDLGFSLYVTEHYRIGEHSWGDTSPTINGHAETILEATTPDCNVDLSDVRVERGYPIEVNVTLIYPDGMVENESRVILKVEGQSISCNYLGNGIYSGSVDTFDLAAGDYTFDIDVELNSRFPTMTFAKLHETERFIVEGENENERDGFPISFDSLVFIVGIVVVVVISAVLFIKMRQRRRTKV